ncbi:hypothetical protein RUM44_000489 [Polyplax serrata]|uniref:Ig-like domain-containing protein n=1 Tax=Polyplax serrata TaxID=468196 RepID=A0ABR1B5K7_POLSC
MLLYFILLYIWLIIPGSGLKITNLTIPSVADVRQTAVLICNFDLENSKLYSVKWYKDDLEFCRFMPDGSPNVQIFTVEGVHITTNECNITTVVLHPLEYLTSGLYTCEVSTEAPYFKTVQTAVNMSVWGIPEKDPTITGLENIYAVGDYVTGNCTSDESLPSSEINWYINDNQVESWQLKQYPIISVDNKFHLKKSVLGVSFQVDHSHFAGKGNTMVLRCVSRVKDVTRQAVHISKLADLDVEKFAQGLYGNGGHPRTRCHFILWLTFLMFISHGSQKAL